MFLRRLVPSQLKAIRLDKRPFRLPLIGLCRELGHPSSRGSRSRQSFSTMKISRPDLAEIVFRSIAIPVFLRLQFAKRTRRPFSLILISLLISSFHRQAEQSIRAQLFRNGTLKQPNFSSDFSKSSACKSPHKIGRILQNYQIIDYKIKLEKSNDKLLLTTNANRRKREH